MYISKYVNKYVGIIPEFAVAEPESGAPPPNENPGYALDCKQR